MDRLEYLRGEIRAERISYGELHELQGLAHLIDPGDVELLEWAGVPEFEDDMDPCHPPSRKWVAIGGLIVAGALFASAVAARMLDLIGAP